MAEEHPAKGNLCGKCLPARYLFALLGSVGVAIIYGLRVNISIALVAMLNHTAIHMKNNDTIPDQADGPFVWDSSTQGTILSCYYWGYLISLIPGALVAEMYSGKWVMLFSIAVNALCALLTPLGAKLHYAYFIVARFLQGLGGGVTFPAMHCLIGAWAPPLERTTISTTVYVGTALGTALSIVTSGVFAKHFGWESIFYIHGGLSFIWIITWIILIEDNPSKQYFITIQEREYIASKLGVSADKPKHKKLYIPVKQIFSSVPFWAILIAHTCGNWGWYLFLIELPFYTKQILGLDISSNAMFSALPYLTMLIVMIGLGRLLDMLRSKGIVSTGTSRKIATGIASIVPIICLLVLCFIDRSPKIALTVVTIGVTSMSAMFCGHLTNHIDLANNYAGTLLALTNIPGTCSGILVPIFVSYITTDNETIESWRLIFFVTITFFIIEFVVFSLFASGKEQPWNKQNDNE